LFYRPGNISTDPTEDLKRATGTSLFYHAGLHTMKIKKAYIATLILGKDQVLATIKEEVRQTPSASDDNIKKGYYN